MNTRPTAAISRQTLLGGGESWSFEYGQRTLPRRKVEICSCRRPLVRRLKVLDVLKASIRWWNHLLFFEGNVRRSPGLDQA